MPVRRKNVTERRSVLAGLAMFMLPGLAGCSMDQLAFSMGRGKSRLAADRGNQEKAIVAWLDRDRKIFVRTDYAPTARYWTGPLPAGGEAGESPGVLLSEFEGAGAAAVALDGDAVTKSTRDAVVAVARDRTDHTVLGEPSPAPHLPGQDAVLVVGFPVLGLVRASDSDPDVALRIRVWGNLRTPAGWLYGKRFVYESDSQRLGVWVANDAKLLRNELAIAIEDVAGQLVDDLLLSGKALESARIQGTDASI